MKNVKKILLLSTGDINGAYEYIYRLAKLFQEEEHIVAMLVKNKSKADHFIFSYSELQKNRTFLKRATLKTKNKFFSGNKEKISFDSNYGFISTDELSINVNPNRIIDLIGFTPDFIFVGMTDEFMNSTDLLHLQQLTKSKVFNITVDMNHFTGGCHYAWNCKGYIEGCKSCPAITSDFGKDLAYVNFETKFSNAKKGGFQILTASGWTLKQAKESLIYKDQSTILNINSLIDQDILNGKNRAFAKNIFNLDQDSFYILMGCQNANSQRKGFDFLVASLKILFQSLDEIQRKKVKVLAVSRALTNSFEEIPFEKKHIEYINDYRLLSLLYQATDVFVNSSIEDSGPMMVSEALACGTPVVGFEMGVVTNLVITGYNGYKAINNDSEDLARGLECIINLSEEEYLKYSINAINQVDEYSSLYYATKLFREILV